MPTKPFSRVRWSLCALTVLLLILSWGYFLVSFKRDYQAIEEYAGQHVRDVALGLEEHARRFFQAHDMILLEVADHLRAAESQQQLRDLIDDWLHRLPQISALRLVAVEDAEILLEVIASPEVLSADIISPAGTPFEGSFSTLQILAMPYRDQAGENHVVIWRQLKVAEQQLMIVALVRTRGLADYFRSLELGPNGSVAFLHKTAEVLAYEPAGEPFVTVAYSDLNHNAELQPGMVGMKKIPADDDSIKHVVAYRKLAGLPLIVAVSSSTDWRFTAWKTRLKGFFIIQLVVSLAILLAIVLLSRALSNIELAEEVLRERESHFRTVANSTVDAVISVTDGQHVQFWSQGAERTFGVKEAEAHGALLSKYLHFDGEQSLAQTLETLARQGAEQESGGTFEVQGIRSNRWTFPTELSVSTGTVSGKPFYTLIVRDVTERKMMEERIRRLASHDNLTRLPNRGLLMDRLAVAMAQVRRQGGQFALLFLDLDEFKPVNDTHGHDVGDLLLQQVAERLQTSVRESDTVARVGGDEFAILLGNAADKNAIASACENILAALSRKFVINDIQTHIGGSIGAAFYTGQDMTGSDLIRLADMAMYAAKRSGKNRFVFAKTAASSAGSDSPD